MELFGLQRFNSQTNYTLYYWSEVQLLGWCWESILHTWQPLWLQNGETSLFTRYERGSLSIWGSMNFLRIKNAPTCQTLGRRNDQILVCLSCFTPMLCRFPLITSNSHIKPWNYRFLDASWSLIYSKNSCKKGIIRVKYHHFWPIFIK